MTLDGPRVVNAEPDGLVPAQYYFADLDVQLVTPWSFLPGNGDTHYVVFVWHDLSASPVDVVPPLRLDGPLTAADFPIPWTIDQGFLLNSAIVELSFRIHLDSPSNPSFDTSDVVRIRIDHDAPGAGGDLAPAIFPVDPITDGYLDLNPQVRMEVPPGYLGREIGDVIHLYFSDTNSLPTGAPTFTAPPLGSATGQIFIDVPHTVFRGFPGARFIFCFYRLRDRAGNLNPQFSEVGQAGLEVDLPPATYPQPQFPQAATNAYGVMTCNNIPPIWQGVEVCIKPGPGPAFQDGDLITMRFQGYRQYRDVDPYPDVVDTFTHVWDSVADASGFSFRIMDVERLIRPLKENAGGEASYMVSRGAASLADLSPGTCGLIASCPHHHHQRPFTAGSGVMALSPERAGTATFVDRTRASRTESGI